MNSDELEQNLKNLTERLVAGQVDLSPENLQDYLDDVASSLAQVFALAQVQIDKGLEQIELATDCLKERDLGPEAESFGSIRDQVRQARNQLEIGREATRQKSNLELRSDKISPQDLMTPGLRQSLERIERILSEVSSL